MLQNVTEAVHRTASEGQPPLNKCCQGMLKTAGKIVITISATIAVVTAGMLISPIAGMYAAVPFLALTASLWCCGNRSAPLPVRPYQRAVTIFPSLNSSRITPLTLPTPERIVRRQTVANPNTNQTHSIPGSGKQAPVFNPSSSSIHPIIRGRMGLVRSIPMQDLRLNENKPPQRSVVQPVRRTPTANLDRLSHIQPPYAKVGKR